MSDDTLKMDTVKKDTVKKDTVTGDPETDQMRLLIDFVAPSTLLRERDRQSAFPIIGNGPPGTFVLFPDGLRISLPTDQIVYADDSTDHARVGFGGMEFVGLEEGQLVFVRVREVQPEERLSPARSHTMRLDPARVQAVAMDGPLVWPHVR